MFRKINTHVKYEVDGVKIRPASLDEEYEIGGWCSSYPWIKIGYEYDKYESKYSDTTYVMIINHEIVGYFMAYSEINIGNNNIIPICGKELILYDFVVDIRAYSKYSRVLINYMINYARYNGYNAITLNKVEKFTLFNDFINRYYKTTETEDKIYLMIENPRIRSCQKYLTIYENDKVQLEDLYFLYDLNFNILKTKCVLKLTDNEEIVINRLTGVISFPEYVKINKDKIILNHYTKALVYLIVSMNCANDKKPITIDYDINNKNYYEAIVDGLLYVSKDLKNIRNDNEYINLLIKKGYDRVVPNHLKYDMNERSFSDSRAIYKLVK